MMSSLFIVGIPRITGTMEVFDSYPAICFAYTIGTKKHFLWEIKYFEIFFSEWAWAWRGDRGEQHWRWGEGK